MQGAPPVVESGEDLDGWHKLAASSLALAKVRPGSLALQLPRHFSVRDLFKWCSRMQHLHSTLLFSRQASSALPISLELRSVSFVECADIFAAMMPSSDLRRSLLLALAHLWGLGDALVSSPLSTHPVNHYVEQYEALHKPHLRDSSQSTSGEALIGRVLLPSHSQDEVASTSTFSSTGHSLRMMERIAACLSQAEPVLLVGETGTGKTTMLSRVATLSGSKLVAFNMSQQTDSSDLLGGFRPVDVRDAMLPLLPSFLALIRKTYTK